MSAEYIAKMLEDEIIRGAYRPGEELKQGEIAERFSISRIPVRDALQLLAARGLIDLVPNRRAKIINLSHSEIREVYDLRILLEVDCLRQSIRQFTANEMRNIETTLAHSNIDASTTNWAEGDWTFHRTLYAPSGRMRQIAMIADLRKTCRVHIAGYGVLPSRTDDWLQDHEDLVTTCRARDEQSAANILSKHISNARQTLLDALTER